jgi:hypothetical protein
VKRFLDGQKTQRGREANVEEGESKGRVVIYKNGLASVTDHDDGVSLNGHGVRGLRLELERDSL